MNILFITDLIPTDKNENCAKALIPIIKELQSEHTVDIIRPNFILNSFIRGKMLKPNGHYNYEGLNILNLNFHTPFLFLDKNFNINLQNYDEIIAHMPSGILFAQKLLSDYKNKTKSK